MSETPLAGTAQPPSFDALTLTLTATVPATMRNSQGRRLVVLVRLLWLAQMMSQQRCAAAS